MSNFFDWIQTKDRSVLKPGLVSTTVNRCRALLFLKNHAISASFIMVSIIAANVALFYLYPRLDYRFEQIVGHSHSSVEAAEPEDISQFGLSIEKINVWAPIIPGVDAGNTSAYLRALKKGIALSKDSASDPTKSGNMFMFGHSNYFNDTPGRFKEIFKSLNQIKRGDAITIYYLGRSYAYEVTGSKKVAADDFSILNPTPENPNDKTLAIMTCWPPGTVMYRWVVFAKQRST